MLLTGKGLLKNSPLDSFEAWWGGEGAKVSVVVLETALNNVSGIESDNVLPFIII